MFKGVKTINTKQAIVHQLISLIKRGSLKPGDKLPSENELMEMLKVGRSSIREAKQILAAMNLIETRPGQGSFVKEVGPETVINWYGIPLRSGKGSSQCCSAQAVLCDNEPTTRISKANIRTAQ